MTFTLFISPKAQKRDRISARGGFARSYKAKDQKLEEDKLLTLLFAHKPPLPLSTALKIKIHAYLPIPKSKPKKWLLMASQGQIRPTSKPDIDNLAKQMLDVMNGVFFVDDRQIVSLHIEKHYGEVPRWEIEITELGH